MKASFHLLFIFPPFNDYFLALINAAALWREKYIKLLRRDRIATVPAEQRWSQECLNESNISIQVLEWV